MKTRYKAACLTEATIIEEKTKQKIKRGGSYGYKFHFNAGSIYAAWFI